MLIPARDTRSFSTIVSLVTIVAIALYRIAPHPWNVAPVGALFALSGLYLGRSWNSWATPFAAVLASDALVYWNWDGSLFHPDRLIDYLAFALVLLAARACARHGLGARICAVLAAPVIFYLVSNFGVWLGSERLYPHTPGGLIDCYVAAIPFFRGTLAGDWLFGLTGLLAIERIPRFIDRKIAAAPSAL